MATTKTIRCCYNCVFAYLDREHTLECYSAGLLNRPACANHPESFGRMRRTPDRGMCPNYRPRPGTPQGDVRMIPLGRGYYTYVDAADYEWLSQWTWHVQNGYAVRYGKKVIFMHREIMQPPDDKLVDHRNHNKLDNTRINLRVCTHQENMQNTRKRSGTTSRFIGVCHCKSCKNKKWRAAIQWKRKPLHIGYFAEEVEAARAYDHKAVELGGQFARVNFPEEWPPERRAQVYAPPADPPRRGE